MGLIKPTKQILINVDGENITPEMFGAVGDGVTDDTQALKSLCSYVNEKGYGKVFFDKGTYKVSIENKTDYGFENRPSILSFINSNVEIDLNGSSIVLDTNNSPFYNIFHFKNCSFKLSNGSLKGDRLTHDYSVYNELTTHEWGHGVNNEGSKGYIENLEISEFTGDGIASGNNVSWEPFTILSRAFINVDNCNIHHCRRQGITIGESNGAVIKNTEIHHIGTFDNISGTSPMSGIDLEFELGESKCDKVILDTVNIYDCTNYSIVGAAEGDVLETLIISNSKINGKIVVKNHTNCIIENTILIMSDVCEILNSKINSSKITLSIDSSLFSDTVFNNCFIEGVYNEETGKGSMICAKTSSIITFNDCIIKNILGNTGILTSDANTKPLRGFNRYQYDYKLIFNNCDIENCSTCVKADAINTIIFNNSEIKECFIYTTSNNEIVNFNDCNIKNIHGYFQWATPIVFKGCNIYDDGIATDSFVRNSRAIVYNCKLNITKTSKNNEYYYIRAYNSYLDYTNPSNAVFNNAELYNCFITCNTPEASFTGTKENTVYIVKE